jgi:2,3-bisphosphoglycerate-dependent phosphoglycerate mutase
VGPTVYLVRHCRASGQEPEAGLTAEGEAQAERLADFLAPLGVERIVSSPFARALASIEPLARRMGLAVETDERLAERVLCGAPRADWREQLRASFEDLDLCLPGGESSRAAMARGRAALEHAARTGASMVVVVSHGNLLALLMRSFDGQFGFDEWARLGNPDVFRLELGEGSRISQVWPGAAPD